MPEAAFVFRGSVVEANGRPASGIDVLIVDDPTDTPAVLLHATTDTAGAFAVTFAVAELVQLFRSAPAGTSIDRREPTLHVLALRGGSIVARGSTEVSLARLTASAPAFTLRIPPAGESTGCQYHVHGRLLEPDARPRPNVAIEIVARRLRRESIVATATTGARGEFSATYRTAEPCDPHRPGLALFVRARVVGGPVLATSPTFCDAPAELEVTLVVGDVPLRGPAAITEVDDAIRDRLDGIPLAELTIDEVEHLACATRTSARNVAWLARASALAERTGVERRAFFAFAHAGVPLTLAAVAGLSEAAILEALTQADEDNVVPPWASGEREEIVRRLRAFALDLTYSTERPLDSLLGRLFEHAGVAATLPREFVTAYVARTTTEPEFWAAFRRTHGDAAVETIQFTLRAAAIVGNHVPLVAALQSERVAGRRPPLARAARRSAREWASLLRDRSRGGAIGAPPGLPGSDDEARIDLYATTLERSFEYAFPTEVTAHMFTNAGDPSVAAFVEHNPDFDLGGTQINAFLAASPALPADAPADLLQRLRRAQRLHVVSPVLGRREPLAAMLAANLSSASQIHRLGPGALARRMPDVQPEIIAGIHRRAGQIAAKVMATFMQYGPASKAALPSMVPAYFIPPSLPTVAGLLGRMDFCACSSCRSVFSPAAYLTDLLHFCDDQGLLDVLLARRPDLAQVRLGCTNTNTVLPTIDLAIEVLEDAVAPPTTPHAYQTTWSADELRAHPEHASAAAYAVLRTASFPWSLPFDMPRAEVRAYLEQLGVSFVELLEAVRGHVEADRHTIALARVGLSPTQGRLVDGSYEFAGPGGSWGVAGQDWVDALSGPQPGRVRALMRRSGLGYDDLLDLAHTSFTGGFSIRFPDETPCELDTAGFDGLSEWRLLRIPRFERLRAALGLSIPELDAMIRALRSPGANPLDAACLDRIAAHLRLRTRLPAIAERTRLAWWGRIDTRRGRHDEPSYYDSIFLDRTLAPSNAAFAIDGDELADVVPIADVHRTVLQAALSISEGDLAALLAAGGADGPFVDLDLRTLSRLLRRVSLARGLGLPIADLLTLVEISGVHPFADADPTVPAEPDATARFVEFVDVVRAAGFAVAELDALLRGNAGSGSYALTDAMVAARLVALVRGLQQIRREYTRSSDGSRSDLDQLTAMLPRAVDAAMVDAVLAVVRTAPTSPVPDAVQAQLARFLDAAQVLAFVSPADPRTETQRVGEALERLLATLRRSASLDFVVQAFADSTGLAPATALVLLGPALPAFLEAPFVDAIEFEADGAAIAASGFPPATWPDVAAQAATVRRIHAAGRVIEVLGLGTTEVSALVERGAARGWFDLLGFPTTSIPGASPAFAAFVELCGVVLECRRFAEPAAALVAILDAADGPVADATLDVLAAAAPWPRDELAFVATEMLSLAGEDLRARIGQLARVFRLLARLGVAAARMHAWAILEPSAATAQAIKNTARAKVEPQAWPAIAGPLRDGLRRRQRDALVAAALQRFGLSDRDVLSDRLLIDVAGEPCQRTSRIRQAIATVQTFVQRVTLSLESTLSLPADAVQQWQWMSRYRVWEANRRVFLYPENYLDPGLRLDASPQFRVLADEVAGSDGDTARIENAYRHYLAELDDIGHLSVCGVYHDREVSGDEVVTDELHVIGRSEGNPSRYYYRCRKQGAEWTAWEEIPGRIENRDATPVVWNRRLLLLWLAIREVAEEFTPAKNKDPEPPKKRLEARLGWMERRHGTWTRPTLSEATMLLPPDRAVYPFQELSKPTASDVGFDVLRGSASLTILPIVQIEERDGDSWHVKHITQDSFALHGDGRASVVVGLPALRLDPRGPRPSRAAYQAFVTPAIRRLRLPLGAPSDPAETATSVPVLRTMHRSEVVTARLAPGTSSAAAAEQGAMFFQDPNHVFLVEPAHPSGWSAYPIAADTSSSHERSFAFTCFYHPYTRWLSAMLEERGIDGFVAPPEHGRWSLFHRQRIEATTFDALHYQPDPSTDLHDADEAIEFDQRKPLSLYNWELFFHGPMLVAGQLAASGRYDDALRWIHAVFDPHDASSDPAPARYWRLKPFFEASVPANIADSLETLSYDGTNVNQLRRRRALELQIDRWRANPFDPHLIARIRPSAYQRWTVMRYLDVLIAWGDALFRQDTLESTNEARQMYMLASRILGPRPEQIERRAPDDRTYAELAPLLDDFSNAIVELENAVPGWKAAAFELATSKPTAQLLLADEPRQLGLSAAVVDDAHAAELAIAGPPTVAHSPSGPAFGGGFATTAPPNPNAGPSLYFCVPPNDKMLAYWDTVADRLFKLRNCLNIEGIRRELALFDPPIDPMLLVRARAQGIDIASAVSALAAPLPHHRFRTMIALAKDLCGDVRALGQAIAQAFERRDAETLAELRSRQERDVLRAVRAVREQQIDEARAGRESLVAARAVAQRRLAFVSTRARRLPEEGRQPELIEASKLDVSTAVTFEDMASAMGIIPNANIGVSGVASPVATLTLGGVSFAAIYSAFARHHNANAQLKQSDASIAGIKAGLQRRDEEWDQEATLAQLEIDRIDRDLAGADVRIAIAEKELANHDRQITNAEDVDEFLRARFSNAELYGQMASELGRVYFAAYQLAFDLAKQAERAYQYELAAPEASFVEFGYWDNTRRGLLAGDKLMHDLRRMEVAYAQYDRRELELAKNVSLALLDPMALVLLRETGECTFELPEALFDLDHPGHYLRRLRSVSVTLPLVEGAHGNVTGSLVLERSSIRRAASLGEALVDDPTADLQQIGLSTGIDDAGVFDRNGDDRRMPFEGRGAVSRWRLTLPATLRQFDYRDISDLVLRVAYTAREGGEVFRAAVVEGLEQALLSAQQTLGLGLVRRLSLTTHFPEAWSVFTGATGPTRALAVDIADVHFPLRLRAGVIRMRRVWLVATFVGDAAPLGFHLRIPIEGGGELTPSVDVSTAFDTRVRTGLALAASGEFSAAATTGRWQLSIPSSELADPGILQDLALVVEYVVGP